jgi:hypothetical protein
MNGQMQDTQQNGAGSKRIRIGGKVVVPTGNAPRPPPPPARNVRPGRGLVMLRTARH